MLNIEIIPILKDNYAYIIHKDGHAVIVDPGEPDQIERALKSLNLSVDYILNTHHHADHVAGNRKLKEIFDCKIIGPEKENARILGLDSLVNENSDLSLLGEQVQIIETPGHTTGHICFFFTDSKYLFCGDALFSMGCGRLFEGNAQTAFTSLQKIKKLPLETLIYCGHEYTVNNGTFAVETAPDNKAIANRLHEAKLLIDNGKPTLPVSLKTELETNLFLIADNVQDFTDIRRRRDSFTMPNS